MGDPKSIKIRIPLTDDAVSKGAFNQSRTVEFDDFKYQVVATKKNVSILVSTKSGQTLAKQRYQFREDSLQNQFGDDGLIGLQFFYHPTTKSELQAWVVVSK